MNNETYLDFCFVRKTQGNFSKEINDLFSALFTGLYLNWFLEEKIEQGADIVIAQVKGMSKWRSEEETIQFLEDQAGKDILGVSARLPDVHLSSKYKGVFQLWNPLNLKI